MYILFIRNHQDSTWLCFVYTRDFILGQTLFKEFTNEIETDKDAFETITIIILYLDQNLWENSTLIQINMLGQFLQITKLVEK